MSVDAEGSVRPERYELIRPLGTGRHGEVFEAVDRSTGERVALKRLISLDSESLYRFKREFRALQGVRHANLIRLYELALLDEQYMFTMELVENAVDLKTYVRGGGAKDINRLGLDGRGLARARSVFIQLTSALTALHSAGLLHRDVKPSNVLVDGNGHVFVVDFGIVAELGGTRSSIEDLCAMVGTPTYMAPEQAANEEASTASDWYALGVSLFEVLAGTTPFTGEAFEILTEKLSGAPPRLRDTWPQAPLELDELCARLMASRQEDRPSGPEIRAQLEDVGRPLEARRSTTPGDAAESRPEVRERPSSRPVFVGRARELALLGEALAASGPGHAVTVFVHASSGMGKTALIERFIETITTKNESGARTLVVTSRCYEHETMPFKAFDGLVDALAERISALSDEDAQALKPDFSAELVRIFPVLDRIAAWEVDANPLSVNDVQLVRWRAFQALRSLLEKLAAEERVVAFIDDVQWSDDDSVFLMETILAPPAPPGILMILGYRSEHEAASPLLAGAKAVADDVRTIALSALPEVDALQLVSRLLRRHMSDEDIRRLIGEAAGSPFFLGELARLSHVEAARLGELRLETLIRERLLGLPVNAQTLLEAIAVAARPVDVSLVWQVAGLEPSVGQAALRTLHEEHLIKTSAIAGRVEPFHDKIREAAALGPDREQLRAIHRRFVECMDNADPKQADILYRHARGAEMNAQAMGFAETAAASAEHALAFEQAASFYAGAIELMPADHPRLQEFRIKFAEALSGSGKVREAGDAYTHASLAERGVRRLELERKAVEQYLSGGHAEVGLPAARRLLETIHIHMRESALVAVFFLVIQLIWIRLRGVDFEAHSESDIDPLELERLDTLYSVGAGVSHLDPIRGGELIAQFVLQSLRVGEPSRVVRAVSGFALMAGMAGGITGRMALVLFENARRITAHHAVTTMDATQTNFLGVSQAFNGRWREAATIIEDSRTAQAREIYFGYAWQRRLADVALGWSYLKTGNLARFHAHAPAFLREVTDAQDRFVVSSVVAYSTYYIGLFQGSSASAREMLEVGLEGWPRDRMTYQLAWYYCAQCDIELFDGDAGAALRKFEVALPEIRRGMLLFLRVFAVETAHLRGRIALANRADAPRQFARVVAHCIGELRGDGGDWALALASMLEAGERAVHGAAEGAAAWERAAMCCRRADLELHAQLSDYRKGELLGGEFGWKTMSRAEGWMRDQGIRAPEKLLRMLAPDGGGARSSSG